MAKGTDFNDDLYISTKFGYTEANVDPHTSMSQAVAGYIEKIGYPIELPDNVHACRTYGISAHVIAKIGKNLFYWLTTDELSSEDGYLESRISILPDGIAVAFPGSRAYKNKGGDAGSVLVRIESAPGRRAMDVAQRLWSLFTAEVSFTVDRNRYDSSTGEVIGTERDLVVHRCFPLDEPHTTLIKSDDETTVEFRLGVRFTRSIRL